MLNIDIQKPVSGIRGQSEKHPDATATRARPSPGEPEKTIDTHFNWKQVDPVKFRPFKPIYYITMGTSHDQCRQA